MKGGRAVAAVLLAVVPAVALACAAASASEPPASPVGAEHVVASDDGAAPPVPVPSEGALPLGGDTGAPVDGGGAPRTDAGARPTDADGGAPRCPNGALVDPHYGFVRCLRADEVDAGAALDGGAAGGPTDAGSADGGEASAGPPPTVEVGPVVVEGGEIKTLAKMLAKLDKPIGRCVADNGGLAGAAGSIKLTFLVRTSERAEGVEVGSRKGVGPEAAVCVRKLLKNKWVGTPTGDPVGVTVTFALKPAPEASGKKSKGDRP